MEHLLLVIFLTLAIASTLSIVLKRFGMSHIIGYIMTGTIISYLFGFNGLNIDTLDRIGQDKPVFVYKLIIEESVEEKILVLQEQKFVLLTVHATLTWLLLFC